MSQPERDYRAIDSCLQEFHGCRVAQTMWSNPFLIQRRAPLSSDSDMLCQQILHTVRAEPDPSGIGKDNLAVAEHGLLEPELQSTCRLLGQRRASPLAPLAEAIHVRTGSQHYILAAQAGHLRKPQASLNRDEEEGVGSA